MLFDYVMPEVISEIASMSVHRPEVEQSCNKN
jgi:hypothetical protein